MYQHADYSVLVHRYFSNRRKPTSEPNISQKAVALNANGIISATAVVCMTDSFHRGILDIKHSSAPPTRRYLHI